MDQGYRTIGVHVNDSAGMPARLRWAARCAADCGAHLVGVATTGLPASFYLGGLTGVGAAALPAYFDKVNAQASEALAQCERAAQAAGVQSFEKRVIEEEPGAALCLQARYSDLLIVGQNDPGDFMTVQGPTVAEYTMLHSVCPVLIVPDAAEATVPAARVLLAWDGGMQAARAVHGAIALLQRASLVQVVVFDAEIGPQAHGEEPGADIALFLSRHGVNVEVVLLSSGRDVGKAILAHAAYFGADLVVMGGYGHSRFREVVLGGATRKVMAEAMVPLLMAH